MSGYVNPSGMRNKQDLRTPQEKAEAEVAIRHSQPAEPAEQVEKSVPVGRIWELLQNSEPAEPDSKLSLFDEACANMSGSVDAILEHFSEHGKIIGDGEWRLREIFKHASEAAEEFEKLVKLTADDSTQPATEKPICPRCQGRGHIDGGATALFKNCPECNPFVEPAEPVTLEIGDWVKAVPPFAFRSGCCGYDGAVVVSVAPLILVSEFGDMLWRETVKLEYVRSTGKAPMSVYAVALKRYHGDYPPSKVVGPKKPCTCVGTCKGAEGLGEGWQCVMEPLPAEPVEQAGGKDGLKELSSFIDRVHWQWPGLTNEVYVPSSIRDKIIEQVQSAITAATSELQAELTKWKEQSFRPLGDNHHNAALCPHCGDPLRKALAEVAELQAKYERLEGKLNRAASELSEVQVYAEGRVRAERKQIELQSQITSLQSQLAAKVGPERPLPTDREIFDAGFRTAVRYGDNHLHYGGEQADAVFAREMEKLRALAKAFPLPPSPSPAR